MGVAGTAIAMPQPHPQPQPKNTQRNFYEHHLTTTNVYNLFRGELYEKCRSRRAGEIGGKIIPNPLGDQGEKIDFSKSSPNQLIF
jgi:hypothetical protein